MLNPFYRFNLKYVRLGMACGLLTLAFMLALTITRPQSAVGASTPGNDAGQLENNPQQIVANLYYWVFSAKFVCGLQDPLTPTGQIGGEPAVKPGNYATEINIHNYWFREVNLRKKIILLVDKGQPVGREPNAQPPQAQVGVLMPKDHAMMDDCNQLWAMLYPTIPPPTPMPLMIGFLVVTSPIDLVVDAVYTAEVPGRLSAAVSPTGISIDVERVNGKRVFVPAGTTP